MHIENKIAKMYFIAVVLPKPLDEKILAYKKWMHEVYGCRVGLKSPAHITIVPPFWMEEEKEGELKNDMEMISHSLPAFSLATANFSAFAPRTIFVAVQQSKDLDAVKKQSDNFFRQAAYKIKIESRPFHPHITIATRDISKKDFAGAWPHFQHKEFVETFTATGLSLLKHNGNLWDVVYTAPFFMPSMDSPVLR